jgi:hypothetical protein
MWLISAARTLQYNLSYSCILVSFKSWFGALCRWRDVETCSSGIPMCTCWRHKFEACVIRSFCFLHRFTKPELHHQFRQCCTVSCFFAKTFVRRTSRTISGQVGPTHNALADIVFALSI